MNRKTIVFVGLLLVLGAVPAVTATHLSAGYEDGIATGPEENPNSKTVTDDRYKVGTDTSCYTPGSEVSAAEVTRVSQADGFCGMLAYHVDEGAFASIEELNHISNKDQDLNDPIGTFDVIRTNVYGWSAGTCLPFCQPDDGQPAGGDEAFDAFHTAGSAAGLTDGPQTANQSESDRSNTVAAWAHVPGATQVIQRNTGFWEMNGWWQPAAMTTFTAYVEDKNGNPIDGQDLKDIVKAEKKAGNLHPSTEPKICAYTPDFVFTTVSPDAPGVNCEFEFSPSKTSSSAPSDTTFDGYDDECQSPTYVCGASNGDAWYFTLCFCLGLVDPKVPGSDPLTGGTSVFNGPEGQTDHIRWHHVVAPHDSACGGAQEPGFSFDSDGAYSHPYLAHDLDVYTTVASTSLHPAGASVPEFWDYADAVAEDHTEELVPTIETAEQTVGDVVSSLPGTPGDVETTASQFVKEDTLEPNNAEAIGDVDDTSRSAENGDLPTDPLNRDLTGACERLFAQETPETVDPWVDLLDSNAEAVQDVDVSLTYASDERIKRRIGVYGSGADGHDGTNRPGPSLYSTDGKVGFFADTDDDGEYDQLEAGVKYNSDTTLAGGASPMFWNMWVEKDDDGSVSVAETESCSMGDAPDETMASAMSQLGYGVNTGLVQAIYLNEPTTFVDTSTGTTQVLPFPGGNNIYLLMSQAARVQYDNDPDTTTPDPLDGEIDTLVNNLQDYAVDKTGQAEPDVIVPGQIANIDAAFTNQCSGRTGNFQSAFQFTHDCQVLDCTGDTIATMYTYEVTPVDGTLQGSEKLPTFSPDGDPYEFGTGQHTWYDVDPFDNDDTRNDDTENAPPSPEAGIAGEGLVDSPGD